MKSVDIRLVHGRLTSSKQQLSAVIIQGVPTWAMKAWNMAYYKFDARYWIETKGFSRNPKPGTLPPTKKRTNAWRLLTSKRDCPEGSRTALLHNWAQTILIWKLTKAEIRCWTMSWQNVLCRNFKFVSSFKSTECCKVPVIKCCILEDLGFSTWKSV
jgi:hypothetical protein